MDHPHEPGDAPDGAALMAGHGGLAAAVEALILMAEEPVAAATLADAIEAPVEEVTQALVELSRFYDDTGRGFELRHVGGGWRLYARPQHAEVIGKWVLSGQQARLSQAALETLSVVAYLQPISRGRVSAVRGVNVDGVMRTLAARNLIEEAGIDEDSGAAVFRTTDCFLERMGLSSLAELPPLAPHLPDATDLEAELGALAAEPAAAGLPAEEPDEIPAEPGPERSPREAVEEEGGHHDE